MEKNKKVIITVVSAILGITLVYFIYKMFGGSSAKKDALAKQKAAASAKKESAADPNNQALIQIAKDAAQSAWDAVFKNKGSKNGDGSIPVKGTTPATADKPSVPMTTVDAAGDYMEDGDGTTLYDKNGNVIGDLDAESGFFLDDKGNKIAACDGSPVKATDQFDNYQDDNGDWYSADGTSITKDGDGTYLEVGNSTDVFNESGDVVGTQNGDGTYTDSTGNDIVLTTGRLIGISSQINSYNSDGSVDYVDGVTLSGDQMTLEQSDGTTIATGGQKVLWYNTDTQDIHYA